MPISTEQPVRADWKVSEVLARYPQLLEVLIDLSPAFRHLRNPLARTLRTRLVSVAQAARIAGLEPNELVRCLNAGAGLDVPEEHAPQAEASEEVAENVSTDSPVVEELDVRPLLARGEEPFEAIMAAIARVPDGAGLRLRTSFEPVPLYQVLARRGFSHSKRQLGPDDWEVVFTRGVHGDVPAPRCARASCQPTPGAPAEAADVGDVVHLDVSDLVPPEPMVRILEAASKLANGQTLVVEHHRRPVYLYPQLDAQGFVHETAELGPGRVVIRIRRA